MRAQRKMKMKMTAVILVLLLAVIGQFASRCMAQSQLGDLLLATESIENPTPCACCNKCGVCDRRAPAWARCTCLDVVPQCHPSCRNCAPVMTSSELQLYRCLDMDFFSCNIPCKPPPYSEAIN